MFCLRVDTGAKSMSMSFSSCDMIFIIQRKIFGLPFYKRYLAEHIKNIFMLCLKHQNFTNELFKNHFNVCQKVQIESPLININFFKPDEK